ncbi:MAG: response regulator transcription factor [Rhodocyclales bacterium]|nr:response regulator transcription factor [Rhodocyclales bacterium]
MRERLAVTAARRARHAFGGGATPHVGDRSGGKIAICIADEQDALGVDLRQCIAAANDMLVSDGEAWPSGLSRCGRAVLILGMRMTERNELDLVRRISRDRPELPILALGSHSEQRYAQRALRAGAAGYLRVNSDRDLLFAVIRKIAAGGIHVSAELAEQMARARMDNARPPPHAALSDREFQVFLMSVDGQAPDQIAHTLARSMKTVACHRNRILRKLNLAHPTQLLSYAAAHGLLE